MSDRKLELQVGVIFLLSVVVLVAGVLWFKNYHLGQKETEVTIEFPTTSGLVRGDLVEVQGVTSGEVAVIRFEGTRSLVTLKLNRGVILYPDSRFVIENVGIMGQKLVAIYPGTPTTAVDPATTVFHGEYQPGIPQLMSQLGGTLEAFGRISNRLDAVIAAMPTDDQSIRRTFTNLNTITEESATFLRDSRAELSQSIRNLNRSMAELHEAVGGRKESVSKLIDNTTRATARLDTTLIALGSTAARVDRLLDQLETGNGTLGKALRNDALYDSLVMTLSQTRALIEDVQKHPKRYVKLSLF